MYVQVLDENDNNPYFVSNVSNVTVMENSKIGTEIAVIQARDSDSGDYGKITYLLDRMSSQVKSGSAHERGKKFSPLSITHTRNFINGSLRLTHN